MILRIHALNDVDEKGPRNDLRWQKDLLSLGYMYILKGMQNSHLSIWDISHARILVVPWD